MWQMHLQINVTLPSTEHLHGLTNIRMQQVICNAHDLPPHIKTI